MQTFHLPDVIREAQTADRRWTEFLRVPALSVGLYRLVAGQADPQQPHGEDEVYYVLSGKARFRAGDDERNVEAGSVLFVEKNVDIASSTSGRILQFWSFLHRRKALRDSVHT